MASRRPSLLRIDVGGCSEAGSDGPNRDFHGALLAHDAPRASRGFAVAVADGIGSSPVGHVAAREAVTAFLEEYAHTPDSRGIANAARDVLELVNAHLYTLTQERCAGEDAERGHVCTFSALLLKGRYAHVLHVGDSRIARLREGRLEVLVSDHHVAGSVSGRQLERALGMRAEVRIDAAMLELALGDVFLLTSDGVHEPLSPDELVRTVGRHPEAPEATAHALVDLARERGGVDDRTACVVRVDALPEPSDEAGSGQSADLPPPPAIEPPILFDGYRVLRLLHANHRSQVHLARDEITGANVVLKLPATDLAAQPALLAHFRREEWVARRAPSPHLLKVHDGPGVRRYTCLASEPIDGVTLRQWMVDHPGPPLDAVRSIARQIVAGLRAMHRKGMVHRDLRPENVMIDGEGTVRIIDFGAVRIMGLADAASGSGEALLGTHQYTAPECLAGDWSSARSDLFSLGTMLYEMLSGRLPYGADAGRVRTRRQQAALRYRSIIDDDRAVPAWIDAALARAVHRDPTKRHDALSEFVADLERPNPRSMISRHVPLVERHPVAFWQVVSALLAAALLVSLAGRAG